MNETTFTYHRNIPVNKKYDLIVAGGGPSGFPAALSARRAGLKVLLVEQTGQLGGVGTSAGVSHLLGGRTRDNSHWCVGGIYKEIVEDLAARGGAINPVNIEGEKFSPFGWCGKANDLTYGVPFDPIQMTVLLDQKLLDAGVDVLFFTSMVDVIVEECRVTNVVVFNKGGLRTIPVSAVVDATGDGDVAARSGCEFVKGREEDGLMTPTTLMFHVHNVDQDVLASDIYKTGSNRFRELIQSLRDAGAWPFPYEVFISAQLNEKGTLMINTTRICGVDGTDGQSISRGMMQGRSEVHELFKVMRKHFPGFDNSSIKMVASVLGIRETRRIVGDYVYTVEDLSAECEFPDTIGFSGYTWDLPDPKRPSHDQRTTNPRMKKLGRTYSPIPYRVMVPRPIENVICPGRSISVEQPVLGPLRVQAACYAMGHAAGLASAQVVRGKMAYRAVNTDGLRDDLREQGAVVDWYE